MKSIFKTICIICLIIFVGCNSRHPQSNNQKAVDSKGDSKTVREVSSDEKSNNIGDKPSTAQLYSEIETRRDISDKLSSDPSTMQKVYTEKVSDNESEFIVRYQQKRIISILNRIYNKENEKIALKLFYFKEDNSCDWYTIMGKGDKYSHEYTFLNGSIVESNYKMTPIVIEDSQKQHIIQSAKAALDSIMKHFPEFKYSFNWK